MSRTDVEAAHEIPPAHAAYRKRRDDPLPLLDLPHVFSGRVSHSRSNRAPMGVSVRSRHQSTYACGRTRDRATPGSVAVTASRTMNSLML